MGVCGLLVQGCDLRFGGQKRTVPVRQLSEHVRAELELTETQRSQLLCEINTNMMSRMDAKSNLHASLHFHCLVMVKKDWTQQSGMCWGCVQSPGALKGSRLALCRHISAGL